MIQAAQRTQQVSEYYFSQKLQQIDDMNRRGETVINLGIGNPDMLPPADALELLSQKVLEPGVHGYQSYKGIPELRQAFANWYEKYYKVMLDPNQEVLPLMGSKEGIMHISLAFLNPGDAVLIPNPGYPTYSSVSQMVGAKIIEYQLNEANNWYPNFEALEEIDLSQVKLMWVNYPHMPTGQPASKELFQKLVDFGQKHQILICNDNPYSFILNEHPLSILSIPGAKNIALELNSLSKSHNMAGFRIGMVAGDPEYINHILKMKSNMDSGMYKPMQMAAARALESSQEWFNTINETYAQRRKLVYQIFDLLETTYDKNQTGMFLWAKIPNKFNDAFEFSDEILKEAKVFITPGSIFGSNGKRFARISLCSNNELLNQALMRLKAVTITLNK
ncbi:MAG: aminotransferase [Bacteroidetes bacterium HGW-Bacteroidetes-4]|jgi:aspartate/methionine/tyrosine aminotransferase|nr:MAG: aminotransferase [Bacteroidetes bacterium HGW-Bacteroidetes-4]